MNNDAYGHTVSMTTDGVTDTYLVGGATEYQFPAGTSQDVVYLSIAQQFNLAQAQAAVQAFVNSRYSLETRFNLMAIWNLCNGNILLLNRTAYVKQIFTWAQAVVTYAATYMATINAMTDPAVVAATTPNFSTLISSDPLVNPVAAIQINN